MAKDLIDVKRGRASLVMRCSPQNAARLRTERSLIKEIEVLQRAIGIIKEIPTGTMLYVKASLPVQESKGFGTVRDIMVVVTPVVINDRSIRCILWAQEKLSHEVSMIERGIRVSYIKLNLKDIIEWRVWEPRDAALTVNFSYLSVAYKSMAFNR
jgi:hypothetical protein